MQSIVFKLTKSYTYSPLKVESYQVRNTIYQGPKDI